MSITCIALPLLSQGKSSAFLLRHTVQPFGKVLSQVCRSRGTRGGALPGTQWSPYDCFSSPLFANPSRRTN